LARLLHVDLKTIHNWVNTEYIIGRRTQGRHLRFDRTEVVRFMRAYGYPVPDAVVARPLRMLMPSSLKARGLGRAAEVTTYEALFSATLEAACGDIEVCLVDLDSADQALWTAFVVALREFEATESLLVIGVSRSGSKRDEFLAAGGDAALPTKQLSDLKQVVRYYVGATDAPPASLTLAEA
jgi:hypothetical protein